MENKNPNEYHGMLVFSLLFMAAIVANKYYPMVVRWFKPLENRLAVGFLILLVVGFFIYRVIAKILNSIDKKAHEKEIFGASEDAVFCGTSFAGEKVYINTGQRAMHTQVIGTTNAGKTESVILPWAIQDMEEDRGLIIVDGKADRSLLDKLHAYAKKYGRENDFKLFSISNIKASHQFNPLIGGTSEEIAERVFNAFEFDNPYYKSVQFEIFAQMLRVFSAAEVVPTFQRLHEALNDPDRIAPELDGKNLDLEAWLKTYTEMNINEREKRTSGLTAALSHFAFGQAACLFNTEKPAIDLDDVLRKKDVVYFQLPVLLSPFLGKATGKLVLQALQSAIANRHRRVMKRKPEFFSVFLDDFTEYLYPGFVSILNKTRSAKIGIVFAHQALGDIKTQGDAIANSILTNSNVKIFMRGNDPESAEYFSRVIGTKEAMKFTERTKTGLVGKDFTGDSSAREVEEFVIHPNRFKSSLGVGEAVVVIPHERGSKTVHMKFRKFKDLERQELASVSKPVAPGLPKVPKQTEQAKEESYEPKK